MRTAALLTSACTIFLSAHFAHSQQIDVTVGASAVVSSKTTTASQSYTPPAEKSGTYPSVSVGYLFKNHLGVNAEISLRAKQGLYNGYQFYRPVFYDVNGVFAPRLGENANVEVMAGIGGERLLFYNKFAGCNPVYPVCLTYVSSNHLLGHVGGGLRYYFWRNFFIRPEAHLYLIHKNVEFSSGYVGRMGASIGYSFGNR